MVEFSKVNQTNIEIYVDEIEPERECNFIVLGALFITKDKKESIVKKLSGARTPDERKIDDINNFENEPIVYKFSNLSSLT